LATMRDRADSRRAVNAGADIAPMGTMGFAGMETNSHANRNSLMPGVRGERSLCRDRGGNGVSRTTKSDEKRVSLRVDLGAPVFVEGATKEYAMLRQNLAVALP